MTTMSIHEAKSKFSSLIARVEDRHEHVIICRYGRAVAELTPIARGKRTVVDKALGKLKIHGDLTQPTVGEWNDA
ncbi:MAG: type II toxin-antitoxin system prevent-host-death family antitoxin [Verrucomicrobia bacterium]|jgi:prevent-host-death family protein|nr:type II toxin-antitoxin system prevent-host-death family antitoxin [Verrucomicrobiota bacterium]MBT7702105.1 type II toxin-antitoxin system prevent-host-death family antitoxin [Verrucomicrobiota bacterium]